MKESQCKVMVYGTVAGVLRVMPGPRRHERCHEAVTVIWKAGHSACGPVVRRIPTHWFRRGVFTLANPCLLLSLVSVNVLLETRVEAFHCPAFYRMCN